MHNLAARLVLACAAFLWFVAPGTAQGFGNTTGYAITTCGSPPVAYTPSTTAVARPGPISIDANGNLCVNATVSATATISGFTALTTGTPIAVTTGGATGSLPAGAVVVATNVGPTNGAYCALGGSASTASQYLSPGGGWFAFTVGASSQLTCVTSTSTTTVNMTGGSGLPTGTGGGGGGGGGGGSVTQGTTPWIIAGQGTAGSAATGVATIQGIAGMTPVQVSQATAANLNATVVGTGTFAAQVTGTVTANAGTNLNTSALATSANQTNKSQVTQIADGAGNIIASTSNNLNVQCANCSGSGASAVDTATFTVGTSVFAPIGGQYTSGGATACVTGHQCLAGMTSAREVMVSDAALLAAAATPLPSMPVNKTPTACGGTIGTGGTAQNAFTAQTTLQGFTIMNLSADPMWMSFTGTAAIGGANDSFLLPAGSSTIAGGSFAAPGGFGTNHALSVIAATTSDAYSCVWW